MREPLHACAACGHAVHRDGPGSGAACPVCGWVDDFEQLVNPDLTYGANHGRSLRQAQAAARAATHPGFRPAEGWRPLRPGEVPVADPDGPSSPVCYLATPDPSDYVPYWRR